MTKYLGFFSGLALTISLLWPLFLAPYFSHHDDVQIIRLHQMDKCIKDLQIPCRWVPDLGGLYGYPLFNYYAPLPYYFGEIIYLLSGSLLISVKIMFAFAFVGSYILMYLLARKFWGELGGSLSAILYSFAPYHAVDFYIRGAMGEMWGLLFFPGLLWAIFRLYNNLKIINIVLVSLFIAGLIASHNLSAVIFLPVVLILVLWLFIKDRQIKFFWFSILSFILGLSIASFYWLPMIAEKNLVHVDSTTSGYFFYTEHFKGLRRLFLDLRWGYGSSLREVPGGEKDPVSFQVGVVHTALFLFTLLGIKFLWRKNKPATQLVIFSTIVILVSIFMINPRSEWVWGLIEPLRFLQFPWRFLLLTVLFTSLLSGSIFLHIKKQRLKLWLFALVVGALIIFNFSYFRPEKFLYIKEQDLLLGANWDRQIKRSIFDYLPIFAQEPPAELAKERYEIVTGEAKISEFKQGTNWLSFKIDTLGHTIVQLSQYYFPNWKIFVNGEEFKFEYKNNHLGLMNFILGKGSYKIEARLYNTPIRTVADWLTIAGVLVTLILALSQVRLFHRWFFYYIRAIR